MLTDMDNTGMVELRANTRLREHLYEQAVTKSEFCDVTLEFGPPNKMKQMGAHWCVLVHCPYFEYMYRFYGNKQDTVRVYDEHIEAIDTAIKFLYTGNATFEIDTVGDVLSIGQYFQMRELFDSCAIYLANLRRCEHNCLKIYFIARQFKLPVYNDIVTYIMNNLVSVIEYPPNGQSIKATIIKELIGHKSACVIRPFVLRNFCRKWRNYDEHRHNEYLDLMTLLTTLTTLSCVSNELIKEVETLEVLTVIANKPMGVYAYVVEEDRWKFITKLPSSLNQTSYWREETTLLAVDPLRECFFVLINKYTQSYVTNDIIIRIHKYDLNSESWSEHNTSLVFNDSDIRQILVNNAMCLNGKLHLVITTLNIFSRPKRVMLLKWKEETATFTKSFLFRFNPRFTFLEDVNSCILNNNNICVVCSVNRCSEREIQLVVQDVQSKEVKLLRPVCKEVHKVDNSCKLITFPSNDNVVIATLESPWYATVNVNTGQLVHINDRLFDVSKLELSKITSRFISGNVEKSVFVLDRECNRGFQFYYGSKSWYRIPTLEYKVGSGTIVQTTLPSTMLHKLSDTPKCECKLSQV
ncbi:hypothetical protein DPMN_074295 [Dreissena polymorpha]|uniref:BTB domain-containing protein n=1 Tax=Dreissena polymorpha TaxID=45954 RepID=A0A9D3YIC1_DREPO|nr:hypothetical protein DPMN_074295 [Dreissena polymorpha]